MSQTLYNREEREKEQINENILPKRDKYQLYYRDSLFSNTTDHHFYKTLQEEEEKEE